MKTSPSLSAFSAASQAARASAATSSVSAVNRADRTVPCDLRPQTRSAPNGARSRPKSVELCSGVVGDAGSDGDAAGFERVEHAPPSRRQIAANIDQFDRSQRQRGFSERASIDATSRSARPAGSAGPARFRRGEIDQTPATPPANSARQPASTSSSRQFSNSRAVDQESLAKRVRPELLGAGAFQFVPENRNAFDACNRRRAQAEHGLDMVEQPHWADHGGVDGRSSRGGMFWPRASVGEPGKDELKRHGGDPWAKYLWRE